MGQQSLVRRKAQGLGVLVALVAPLTAQDAATKRAETRQRVQREYATMLVALTKRAAAEDDFLVGIARSPAVLLDATFVMESDVPRNGVQKDHGNNMPAMAQFCEAVQEGCEINDGGLAAVRKVSPLLAEIAVVRRAAARALEPVASDYLAAGEVDSAHEVATLCLRVYRSAGAEVYGKTSERVAAARFAATTKPFLEQLRRSHDKIGRAKR